MKADVLAQHNKPDIAVQDKKKLTIIEMYVTFQNRLKTCEDIKL